MGFITKCRRTGWRFNSEPENFLNPVCDFGIGPRARRKSLSVSVVGAWQTRAHAPFFCALQFGISSWMLAGSRTNLREEVRSLLEISDQVSSSRVGFHSV
jgi:hypothetical protein